VFFCCFFFKNSLKLLQFFLKKWDKIENKNKKQVKSSFASKYAFCEIQVLLTWSASYKFCYRGLRVTKVPIVAGGLRYLKNAFGSYVRFVSDSRQPLYWKQTPWRLLNRYRAQLLGLVISYHNISQKYSDQNASYNLI